MNRPYTIGLICARGGSKGVPRKNLRPLGGKPLIGWAIDVARNCPSIDRVIVSTEDPEIADVARAFGADLPFCRPAELAQDDSPEILVWKHAIRTLGEQEGRAPEVLVNIPTTAPLRAVDDVERCVRKLFDDSADLCITVRHAHHNPYFNMVRIENGRVSIAVKPPNVISRRQDAPEIFEITTVAYAASAKYVVSTDRLLSGNVSASLVPEERALDIDTELDFAFAEFLLDRKEKTDSKSV